MSASIFRKLFPVLFVLRCDSHCTSGNTSGGLAAKGVHIGALMINDYLYYFGAPYCNYGVLGPKTLF